MSEMLERIAEHLGGFNCDRDDPCDGAHDLLEAMRHPTAAMVIAGSQARAAGTDVAISVWHAMIEAALAKGEEIKP